MSRTDDILDKTKRKEPGAKKWKVVAGIVLGLGIVMVTFLGILWIVDVDGYLESKSIIKIYNAYEMKADDDSNFAYYLGDSTASYSIYPPLIREELNESGYSFSLFGVSIGNEAPLMRVLQIQNIIDSTPSAVIYAISYRHVSDYENWVPENLYLVHDSLNVRDDSLYLYTEDEINDINHVMNPYDKRIFISSAFNEKYKLSSSSNNKGDTSWHDEDGIYYNLGDTRGSMQHGLEEIIDAAKNPQNSFRPEVTNESTRNKAALLYISQTLAENNIPLIFISTPINPIMADEISSESRQNFHDFLNSTDAVWYDMEYAIPSEYFVDVYHLGEEGCLLFSPMLADIIVQEVENNVIHYS